MRRLWIYAVLLVATGFVVFQLYRAYTSEVALSGDFQRISSETEALINDNQDLSQQIQYYSDPYNLEKKLRSQTNYRSPNENLMITTPKQ